jgi:dienelactone hydrolase
MVASTAPPGALLQANFRRRLVRVGTSKRSLDLSVLVSVRVADFNVPRIRKADAKWLAKAMLALLLAVPAPARAAETVFFPSLDGFVTGGKPTELDGLLMRPDGPGPFPAIVALHGCGGLLKEGALVAREAAWAKLLTSHGYVVLFPDSFGPRGVTTDCEGAVRAWAERSYDAYGALRYLQAQSFIVGGRIGVMGWSHGGGTVIFAIAPNSIARPADLPKGDFRAAVAFYPAWCSRLSTDWKPDIPFLLEIGAEDDSIQPAPCIERAQSAKAGGAPTQIKVYDDAVHDFDWPGDTLHTIVSPSGKAAHYGVNEDARADALIRVLAFFDARLKP